MDQIILFGDSITQGSFDPNYIGWGIYISHFYNRKLDVLNRGYGGFNTSWCKTLLPDILQTSLPSTSSFRQPTPPKIKLVTILLGANDAIDPTKGGFPQQYVDVAAYKQNLRVMIEEIKKVSPVTCVLLITPPPVDKRAELERTLERVLEYRKACIQLVDELLRSETYKKTLALFDCWSSIFETANPQPPFDLQKLNGVFYDGIHLDVKGNRLIGQGILKKVVEVWPELDAEKSEGWKMPVRNFDAFDPKSVQDGGLYEVYYQK
ncbi:hypothetical protein HDV05_001292 [Chytridiales sp. JEL 0842]|nr:hypothetical protein HDV05_001292 [Chytridiales sp. JEL 0842]